MKNSKYIENASLLLLQTDLNEEQCDTIPEHQLNDVIEYIEDLKDIKAMKQALGAQCGDDDLRHDLWNLKEKINKTKQDESALHPEVAKLYTKLDHAIYYEEEALIRKQESDMILGQLFTGIYYIKA